MKQSYTVTAVASRGNRLMKWLGSEGCHTLISFWLLGVGVDFGYWAVLTAAHDLLSQGEDTGRDVNSTARECNHLSTGVILVTNIVPNVLMKMLLPFLPLWIHGRTLLAIVSSVAGFALAAWKQTKVFMLSGVVLCSISVGIGESSYLMYIPYFKDKKVVSAWASGTGASGFLASLTYLGLITSGVSLSTTLNTMIAVPLLMAFVFWLLLKHPNIEKQRVDISLDHPTTFDTTTLKEKCKILYRLIFTYTLPFFLVFLFQYIINQGLFELIHFKNSFVDLATQVRWFNFNYLIALFISKSSGLWKVDHLWLMVLLQVLNLVIMTTESIYGWMDGFSYSFWIVAALIFWEGLIAGVSYVNTYRKINEEMPTDQRQFSMSINSVGASLGMMFAGIIAILLHNFICDLPPL